MTKNLVAIYYGWYDENNKECINPDSGNVKDCSALGKSNEVYNCPSTNDHRTMYPSRWAGRYKINYNDTLFPNGNLYSSTDENVIRWQLGMMKKAGIEGLAFSYWGSQKPITVTAFKSLFNVLTSSNNPHPNIKISIYYEDQVNRAQSIVESDVQYILDNYADSPFFYKINNKPVFWVYTNSTLSMAQKWNKIRINKGIYSIQKEFSGWTSNLSLSDSWHQYAPAGRIIITEDASKVYCVGVSAGFWRYHACSRLDRCDVTGDFSSFENGLITAKNANPQHIIVFWNEWQENSGIEPATLYKHIEGPASVGGFPKIANSYSTKYIDIIAKHFVIGRPSPCPPLGDIDDDGIILASDALLALKIAVGEKGFTPEQIKRADVDKNGKVTTSDALEILRYSVGEINTFSGCK